MGKKLWNLLLFLIVVAACSCLTFFIGQDASGMMIYNFIFLSIMVFIYLLGMILGMWKMNDLGTSLYQAGVKLEEYFGKEERESRLSQMLDTLFKEVYLDHKMKNFLLGMKKSKEGIVDLEEYLNEEEIDNFIHKRMLEMVPDILTSLGILGTFVGLILGLRNFEPSSYETMTSSVSLLVDGIKVAFLTSIYGVSLSIVYTYGVKSEYSRMIEELQDFLAKFHGYVMPSAESKSRNLMVATQKKQTEAMGDMVNAFSEQMISSFQDMLSPAFEKMNSTLEDLSDTVNVRQQEALKEIVNAFLLEMHHTMQIEFNDFRDVMEQLTASQKENVAFTKSLYQNLSEEMKNSNVQAAENMNKMMDNLGTTQNQYLTTAKEMLEESHKIQEKQQKDYEQLTEYLREAEKSSAKFWVACNQAMQKYVETASEGIGRFDKVGEECEKTLKSNQKVVESFDSKIKDMTEYQKLNYQVMLEMCKLLKGMSVISDEKNMYLVGGNAAGKLSKNASQQTLLSMKELMEEQTRNQQEFLQEMTQSLHEIAKSNQKKKHGLFS